MLRVFSSGRWVPRNSWKSFSEDSIIGLGRAKDKDIKDKIHQQVEMEMALHVMDHKVNTRLSGILFFRLSFLQRILIFLFLGIGKGIVL